jgi:hypothetical protein
MAHRMSRRSSYKWSPSTGRYVRPNGRFVAKVDVRAAIDAALEKESAKAVLLSQELRNGTISLSAWREEMRIMIKNVHVYNAAIAKGGFAQMTAADYGRVGQIVRGEYGFLEGFARGIASGKVPLDGRFTERAKQYAQAGRGTYHQTERAIMKAAGMTKEWNILHPADHCGGCLGETARGKVPIGSLIPIGGRTCRRKCRCTLGFS